MNQKINDLLRRRAEVCNEISCIQRSIFLNENIPYVLLSVTAQDFIDSLYDSLQEAEKNLREIDNQLKQLNDRVSD